MSKNIGSKYRVFTGSAKKTIGGMKQKDLKETRDYSKLSGHL